MSKPSSIDKALFLGLKDTLTETPTTPTQKITAIASKNVSAKAEEAPFTLWIPKVLMKKIRLKAIEKETTIKEVILEAISKNI